ncbi:META domain-containing protein [Flavobacteriaceae bacterium R38]|nr:META domain-containing protein [Flavobacteriaceae bacterium R38]
MKTFYNKYPIILLAILLASCSSINTSDTNNMLQGTTWKLVEIVKDDIKENIEDDVVLNISFSKEEINGTSGCNTYFGQYSLKKDSEIELILGGTTLMICEENIQKYEDIFVVQIEKVKRMQLDENILYLRIDDSNYLLFHKI